MGVTAEQAEIGRLAGRLSNSYYAVLVAHLVASNPISINSLPDNGPPGVDPIGKVPRKEGSFHQLNLRYYLDLYREKPDLQTDALRASAAGGLLILGDALQQHGYFDRNPTLELVRHLRNGLAHGNRFEIRGGGLERFPARNRDAPVRSYLGTVFEITSGIAGQPVLFEFMLPGDVLDLLQSVDVMMRP